LFLCTPIFSRRGFGQSKPNPDAYSNNLDRQGAEELFLGLMRASHPGRFLCLIAFAALAPRYAFADVAEQTRIAFRNIRADDIPRNAVTAADWIIQNRDQLVPELQDELYRTDRQGRDVILFALMEAKSFQPDARFCRTLVSRLNDEDHYVKNQDVLLWTHWHAWKYIDQHYDLFRALVLENLQTSNDMWCIWGTICLLQKHGELTAEVSKFSPHVWETVAKSLRSDDVEGNAGQAIRFYLIIGKPSLPHLEPLAKSDEEQTRDFAAATIDAMKGSRRAYGYLASQVMIDRDVFKREVGPPDWLSDEVGKWNPGSDPRQRYR
jgi:hypothetical protein